MVNLDLLGPLTYVSLERIINHTPKFGTVTPTIYHYPKHSSLKFKVNKKYIFIFTLVIIIKVI